MKEKRNVMDDIFSKIEKADILYAAKDIPIYHMPENSLFAKFKLYVFLNILSDSSKTHLLSLKEFTPKPSMLQAAANFRRSFKQA